MWQGIDVNILFTFYNEPESEKLGCNTKMDNRESEIKQSNNVPLAATRKYFFYVDKMETVEISVDDLLNRKKVESYLFSSLTLSGLVIVIILNRLLIM